MLSTPVHTTGTDSDWMPAASGAARPLVSVLVPSYNGASYLREMLDSLLAQTYECLEIILLDDASTDGTAALVEPYLGRGVLAIEHLAESGDDSASGFAWERILLKKTRLATELDADWFIHHDADEFRESPWLHLPLIDAIRQVDALGFNAIDFSGLDFWPVDDTFRPGNDVRLALTSYSEPAPYDRLQIRAWKKTGSERRTPKCPCTSITARRIK